MDEQVSAAMARWPDVPAVFGWLSLTESGQWRLHPQGDALRDTASPGEDITSPQILAFVNRNYDVDASGQWYFQNGPQRVYVRLDAAPYVAHTTLDTASGRLKLRTHTGLDIRQISALFLSSTGRLYATTDRGPILIAGRDLVTLLDALQSDTDSERPGQDDIHEALSRCLTQQMTVTLRTGDVIGFPVAGIPLHYCPEDELERRLQFRRYPQPADNPQQTSSPSADGAQG